MKEQVSVDNDFVNKVMDIVGMGPIAWDTVNPAELCQAVIDVYLDSNDEIRRLKRLDENVKKLICDLKEGKLKSGKVTFNHVKLYIEDLESLDK